MDAFWRRIRYFFAQGWKNIMRNKIMSFSSILTVAISLLIVGVFMLFIMNAASFIENQKNNTQISVFIKPSTSQEELAVIEETIKDLPQVADVKFISQDEAKENFVGKYMPQEEWDELFKDSNPMPFTYEVTAENSEVLEDLSAEIGKVPGVYKVDYMKEFVVQLTRIMEISRIVGAVAIAVLFLAAGFLIFTTIRLSVYTKKKEIEMMKFVGSSNALIRGPFIISGVLLGFFGSLVASIITYVAYYFVMEKLGNIAILDIAFDMQQILLVIGVLLVAGIVTGMVGSFLSLKKHLSV